MDFQTLITLVLIGLAAGIASGFIGIGGGIVIIPALIYFLGLTQFQAQGVSLTLMLPPIGVLAFYNYYQEGHLSKPLIIYALIMGGAFIIGGFIGSKASLKSIAQIYRSNVSLKHSMLFHGIPSSSIRFNAIHGFNTIQLPFLLCTTH